jgi:hypothetical protein
VNELTGELRASIEKDLGVRRAKAKKSKPMPKLAEVRMLAKHKVFVRFRDGVQGVYDIGHLQPTGLRASTGKTERKRAVKKRRPRTRKA